MSIIRHHQTENSIHVYRDASLVGKVGIPPYSINPNYRFRLLNDNDSTIICVGCNLLTDLREMVNTILEYSGPTTDTFCFFQLTYLNDEVTEEKIDEFVNTSTYDPDCHGSEYDSPHKDGYSSGSDISYIDYP
jgi:hypothetical protein